MDHVSSNPDAGVPAIDTPSDAFVAGGVIPMQATVGLVFTACAEAQIGARIVQLVVIDVVNVAPPWRVHDDPVQIDVNPLAMVDFGSRWRTLSSSGTIVIHQEGVIGIIDKRGISTVCEGNPLGHGNVPEWGRVRGS